jgi:hypothetical protein
MEHLQMFILLNTQLLTLKQMLFKLLSLVLQIRVGLDFKLVMEIFHQQEQPL